MKKMYIIIIVAIILAAVIGGFYWYSNYKLGKMQYYYGFDNPSIPPTSNTLKAYSLSYTTFNPSADHPEFKHVLVEGNSWTTFIIPLKGYANIKDDTYLITKFSHPVLPKAVPESVAGSTYMYSVKDRKATPWPGDLKYENGALDARMAWGGVQGQNVSMIIKIVQKNIISVNGINEFEQITKLPGFEQATYREVKNTDAP